MSALLSPDCGGAGVAVGIGDALAEALALALGFELGGWEAAPHADAARSTPARRAEVRVLLGCMAEPRDWIRLTLSTRRDTRAYCAPTGRHQVFVAAMRRLRKGGAGWPARPISSRSRSDTRSASSTRSRRSSPCPGIPARRGAAPPWR